MPLVTELIFFYGTLMAGFDRRRRAGIDDKLVYVGRAHIRGQLFDLGIYPVAVPGPEGQVWGEVYRTESPREVLTALDDIEGYRADDPDKSLYARQLAQVVLPNGRADEAWVYFYNAPLGKAQLIPSGDYLAHVTGR
jgi:gamma-glutamylcyclotransferase (GGCT)/AIG2-like uncharacterized protein YtfP